MSLPIDPAAVVQRQLDAYNARDLDGLLAAYAEDAELYEHPATLLARGHAAMRERFGARFREPNLHAALLSRVVMGHVVVDHEEVTRTFPEGTGRIRLLMSLPSVRGSFHQQVNVACISLSCAPTFAERQEVALAGHGQRRDPVGMVTILAGTVDRRWRGVLSLGGEICVQTDQHAEQGCSPYGPGGSVPGRSRPRPREPPVYRRNARETGTFHSEPSGGRA